MSRRGVSSSAHSHRVRVAEIGGGMEKAMDVKVAVDGGKATITPDGKLTVQTSPELVLATENLPVDVCDFDIDLTNVSYIASAGLRVLVSAGKLALKRGGRLHLLHPCDDVWDVLEMTGLSEVLSVER